MSRPPIATGPQVARNILYSGLSQAWSVLLLIVSIPIVVHGLGEAAYGVYVIASVLLGYAALLDLGLTPSVVRLIAIHYGRGSERNLERIIGTAFACLIVLAVIGGGGLALLARFAATSFLHIPQSLQPDAVFVLYLAALGFSCNLCLTLFLAVPQGLQRLDLFAIRSVALTTATAAAQIAAVKLGGGLRWVAAVTIAINVLSVAVFVLVAHRLLPSISFRPRLDRWALGELAGFGAMRFLNQASGQVVFQLDRLILAAFLPIGAVTLYSVPLSIAQKFVLVQAMFATAFFPAASELHGLRDAGRLQQLYLSSLKLAVVLVLPLAIFVGGFARPILDAWIGRDFAAASSTILLVLAVAYGVSQVIGVPALASDATGHAHWSAGFAMLSAVINLSLTLILVPRIGAIGAAYALLINSGTQGLLFIYIVQRWFLGLPLSLVLRRALFWPASAGLAIAAYTVLVSPQVRGLWQLLLALVGGGILYLALLLVLPVWDSRERNVIRSVGQTVVSGFLKRSTA